MSVLKAVLDAGNDSTVTKNLGANYADLYVQFDYYVPQATFDDCLVDLQVAKILNLIDPFNTPLRQAIISFNTDWAWDADGIHTLGVPDGVGMEADVWHTFAIHFVSGGGDFDLTTRIDGVEYGPEKTSPGGANVRKISLGLFSGNTDLVPPGYSMFFDNVLVGTTTWGSSDVFSDDFESGTLAAWTTTANDVSVVDNSAVVPPSPYWKVEHREHEFLPDTVGQPDIVADGGNALINTVRPENLHFVLRLGVLGPEDADYELANTALDDVTGDPVITADFVGAYRTDFRIKRSDITDPILAGMHTEAPAGSDGEQPNDHVRIAGKGFLHYLEKRTWPYDADLSYIDWPDGFRFKAAAAQISQIVTDILETVRDVSPNWPDPPDALGTVAGLFSYGLGYTLDIDTITDTRDFEIGAFEQATIYELIQTLAQAHKDDGGFDFLMTWDKVFTVVAPEIGNPAVPIFTLEVDATTHIPNLIEAGFSNTGPDATHLLGVGAGTANRQGGVNKHSRENSARYRRLDRISDFGDVKDLDALEALTADALVAGVQPIHELPITVNPADIPGFWEITRPGEYIEVVYDFGWHAVNSVQRIVEMDCHVSTEGDETVALSLNQHYDLDPADGIVDW